jgi:hypothetical protein
MLKYLTLLLNPIFTKIIMPRKRTEYSQTADENQNYEEKHP